MMRRAALATGLIVALALAAGLVATWQLSRPKLDGRLAGDPLDRLQVAPIDTAVTLARVGEDDGSRVVLVTHAGPEGLDAVDLQTAFGRRFPDAVAAFESLGFEALTEAARGTATTRVAYEALGVPLDAAYPHVAAGTNFRAHAEEVGREEGPFLFPKLSEPTPWNADVPDRARLDFEAEICAVLLSTHTASEPARLGFVLCNDFTDRWTLVRGMQLDAAMGTTGFPDGKGGAGMLPVGPLLVIPRDADGFRRELDLELYVNDALRQRAVGGQMIWSPAEILDHALAGCAVVYHREAGTIPLTDCNGIPMRTLILTGTPGGVLFHPLTLWSKRAYLEPGDEVVTFSSRLGSLRNRIH